MLDDDDNKLKLSRLSSFALSIFPRARDCAESREVAQSDAEYHVKLRAFSTPAFDQSTCVSVTVESARCDRRR